MKRFFSATYHAKDLFVYRNGDITIRERSRDQNHMLQLMNQNPFDMVAIENLD